MAGTTSTTKKNAAAPTDAKVGAKRTVTYTITTNVKGDSTVRNLAYAVAVDDVVLDEYKETVKKTTADGATKITVTVDPGKKVSLYLNSDAVPGRRKNPVYAVTPKDKNVQVTITEKLGKHSDADTPVLAGSDKTLEKYTAPLTGDIWLKVTHKFTAAEVDTLLPAGTRAEIIAAVKSVYNTLPGNTLSMTIATPAFTTTLTFGGNENAKNNITTFSLTADGLPRVHPACYAAILTAAVDASASSIVMSSNWRPCLGSIAHRCGLGADVTNIDGTQMLNTAADNSRVLQLKNAYNTSKTPAAKAAWEKARDADQPVKVQSFRRSLQQNAGIKQVLDPWEVDLNTRDTTAATANLGGDTNAKMHLNHLHITARDEHLIK